MAAGERSGRTPEPPLGPTGLQVPIPNHPYAPFLAGLDKPGRYAGGEVGAIRKPWEAVDARVCLAFPDVFEIGMSHLGLRILYQVLNADPRLLAERCYCPWLDLEAELRGRNLPLCSLESGKPLGAFDVVGFSLQFELTYTNVLTMLDLGGIPRRAADRHDGDPLVLAGGPTALHPEPVADFFDAIVMGDGEGELGDIVRLDADLRARGVRRRERLAALAERRAVYVPSAHPVVPDPASGLGIVGAAAAGGPTLPVRRARVDLGDYPFPTTGPTGGPEAVFDRTSVEIARGCHEGCRFCQAGMTYRPMRERDPVAVIDCALQSVGRQGTDAVSLTALSPADVSYLRPLVPTLAATLAERGVGLGVSSLRAYGLAPELLDELRRMRAAGLTFAPEAGTQRLRDVINKNVDEVQLVEAAERVFARGWNRLKLYFMIGLPTETDEDVHAIVATAARIALAGRRAANRRVTVTVSVSNHVPKPHTPFQWEAMDGLGELHRKQRLLRQLVRSHRSVTLRVHDADASRLEGVLSRGDRRLGAVIERAWELGARFDSWTEQLRLDCWQRAFAASEIDPSAYLERLDDEAPTPWSHVDVGVDRSFLRRERRRALRAKPTLPCGREAPRGAASEQRSGAVEDRRWVCHRCGADCDLDALRAERQRRIGALAGLAGATEPGGGAAPGPARIGTERAGHRLRLRYEKLGAAALLGHLDLIREVGRVFRRVGVDLVHTAGFHPKPVMSFAPALALGVGGLAELCDLRLEHALDRSELDRLIGRMTEASPEGLRFCGAEPLAAEAASVSRRCDGARYWVVVEPMPRGRRSRSELVDRCAELLACDALPMRRRRKGRERVVDLRPWLLAARVAERRGAELLGPIGFSDEAMVVEFDVRITTTGSPKPAELAAALLGSHAEPHGLLRACLLTDDGEGDWVPL